MHEVPAYVPWIVFLPALAAVIQHFFGRKLPRQGDFLVVGAMLGALVLTRENALVMAAAVALWLWAAGSFGLPSSAYLDVAGGVTVGILVYLGAAAACGSTEVGQMVRVARRLLGRPAP